MEYTPEKQSCEHGYVFLRQFTEEVSWHNFVTFDVFYCAKCLDQQKIEAFKPATRRW